MIYRLHIWFPLQICIGHDLNIFIGFHYKFVFVMIFFFRYDYYYVFCLTFHTPVQ